MADTIREQIIAAYVTRLASWTTAGGFNHNCGASVFRMAPYIDPGDVPAGNLFPQVEEVTQKYGFNTCSMMVRVEGTAEVGTTNPSVIQEQLLGDAIKIMTDPDVAVTSLIEDILYVSGGPDSVPKGEDTTVCVFAEFKIVYNTLSGNPYSQG